MWMLLQLADSAFPSGGFAHSAGLEALVQHGELRSRAALQQHCLEHVTAVACSALPIVGAAFDEPAQLATLDAFTRATLWSAVAARASRAQGRSLLDVAARAFELPDLVDARAQLATLDGHLAPVFGVVARALALPRDAALAAYLHLAVRGTSSAAVRLGIVGPVEAQRLHHALHPAMQAALDRARTATLDDVAQTAPLTELFGALHDRLYSRLFQS